MPTPDHRRGLKPRCNSLFPNTQPLNPSPCTKFQSLIQTLLRDSRLPCRLHPVRSGPPNVPRTLPLHHRLRKHAPSRSAEDLRRLHLRELELTAVSPLLRLDLPQSLHPVFLDGVPKQAARIRVVAVQPRQVTPTALQTGTLHQEQRNKAGRSEKESGKNEGGRL